MWALSFSQKFSPLSWNKQNVFYFIIKEDYFDQKSVKNLRTGRECDYIFAIVNYGNLIHNNLHKNPKTIITQIVTITKVVKFTQIVTPFLRQENVTLMSGNSIYLISHDFKWDFWQSEINGFKSLVAIYIVNADSWTKLEKGAVTFVKKSFLLLI